MAVGQHGRWANKAVVPIRQAGQQGIQATRHAGQHGSWANKADGPTMHAGQRGSQANEAGRPTRQAVLDQ